MSSFYSQESKKNLPLWAQTWKLYSDHLLHDRYYVRQYACSLCFGKSPLASKGIRDPEIAFWKMLANILYFGYTLIFFFQINWIILPYTLFFALSLAYSNIQAHAINLFIKILWSNDCPPGLLYVEQYI